MFLLLVLVNLPFAASTKAQEATATLRGTITDENHKPVQNAKITATDLKANQTREATSEQDGNYTLTGLVADRHEVKVESPGHKPRRYPGVVLVAGKTTTLDVKLAAVAAGTPLASATHPRFNAGIGYSYVHERALNGFDGGFAALFGPVGIEATAGMGFSSSSTLNRRVSWIGVGPLFQLPGNARITPWAHVNVGGIFHHDTDKLPPNAVLARHGFLMKAGGGVNVKCNRWVAWNLITFDYFMSRIQGSTENSFQVKSGIVFTWGGQ